MDPISLALKLGEFVPSIIGWFTGDDKDKERAEKVLDIAKDFAGSDDHSTIFRNNPELAMEFQKQVMNYQITIAKEDTKKMQAVNATMIAEGKSEHWMQWSWRPFNGYLFGITLFLGYVIPLILNGAFAAFHVVDKILEGQQVIEVVRTVPYAVIPEFVLVAWGTVLGVTSWQRGKEKLSKVAGKLL